jgi:hypothetical protein
MPWAYIRSLLGPGLHWSRSQEELLAAIDRARADGERDAAEHLEIILDLRNYVMCEEKTPRTQRGENDSGSTEETD